MARQIKGTIPLKHEALAIEAICKMYNRPQKIRQQDGTEIDNPVSAVDFTNNVIKSFIKENIKAYKASLAAEKAREAALSDLDKDLNFDTDE